MSIKLVNNYHYSLFLMCFLFIESFYEKLEDKYCVDHITDVDIFGNKTYQTVEEAKSACSLRPDCGSISFKRSCDDKPKDVILATPVCTLTKDTPSCTYLKKPYGNIFLFLDVPGTFRCIVFLNRSN